VRVDGDELPALPRATGAARSLAEARPGHMLLVRPSGDVVGVRSWAMLRGLLSLAVVVGVLIFGTGYLGGALFGPLGAFVLPTLAYVGMAVWLRQQGRIGRALRQLGADDLRGAERTARALASSRMVSAGIRGNALYIAASAVWLRGDLEEALALTRRARAELARTRSTALRPIVALAALHEIQLLALTGHLADARAQMDALEPTLPPGDLVQVQRIDTELVLAFESDDPSALPDDLDPWTQTVLATQRFGSTLVLLAWAHDRRDEPELAAALLDVAHDRLPECHLDAAHPRLAAWYRGAVGSAS
jgi:hypothetical protein